MARHTTTTSQAPEVTAAAAWWIVATEAAPPPGIRVVYARSRTPRQRDSPISSLPSIVKVIMPSTSAGLIPASSRAALEASAASCSSLRPEFLENSVCPIPAMAANLATGTPWGGGEDGDRLAAAGRREAHLDCHAAAHVLRSHVDDVRHQANTLLQLDERDDRCLGESDRGRMPRDHPAGDLAATAELDGLAPDAVARRAHRARRVRDLLAVGAALAEQLTARGALPEEHRIGGEHRVWAGGGARNRGLVGTHLFLLRRGRRLRLPGAADLAMAFLQAPGEHAVLAQLLDLLSRVAKLSQDLAAVLPDHQRRSLHAPRGLGEIEQQADLVQPADEGMLVGGHPAALFELGVIVQAEGELRIGDLARHLRGIEHLEPLGRGALAQLRLEQRRERRIVPGARRRAREACIGGKRGQSERCAQARPLTLGDRDHAQPARARFVQAVGRAVAELHAIGVRAREARAIGASHGVGTVEQLRIHDRGVAELALAGAVTVVERLNDGDGGEKAIAGVAQARERPQGLAAPGHAAVLVLDAGEAGPGLVVPGQALARAG